MKEGSSAPGADYNERKEEINEQLEEIDDIEQDLESMKLGFKTSSDCKKQILEKLNRAKTPDDMSKISKELMEQKDNIMNILNDAVDAKEQLEILRKDIGDCDIPMTLTKRKTEFNNFCNRLKRLQNDAKNMRNANSKQDNKDVKDLMKEVDFKIKTFEKSKVDLSAQQVKEFDGLKPLDFEDYLQNYDIIKRVRKFKNTLGDQSGKLKELEDI